MDVYELHEQQMSKYSKEEREIMDNAYIVHNELCIELYRCNKRHFVKLYNLEKKEATWLIVNYTARSGKRFYSFKIYKTNMDEKYCKYAVSFFHLNKESIIRLLLSGVKGTEEYDLERYNEWVHLVNRIEV